MKRYVLDTNLYVRAFRNAEDARLLSGFYADFAPAVYLSSIVLHELLVGATNQAKRNQVDDSLARPLQRAKRIVTPSHAAWDQAGRALGDLVKAELQDLRRVAKSFVNDVLLAASCREAGLTLVTDNVADFERIRRVIRLRFEPPWPS